MFTPKIREDEAILTHFSDGLVQPPTSCGTCEWFFLLILTIHIPIIPTLEKGKRNSSILGIGYSWEVPWRVFVFACLHSFLDIGMWENNEHICLQRTV